ncbi:MAG TPA: hypothetical protein VE665_09830 [Hyphomicrobiaceae bacterium]|nr:hypothetical protein [Hyphomicrobiaceae bacterium]
MGWRARSIATAKLCDNFAAARRNFVAVIALEKAASRPTAASPISEIANMSSRMMSFLSALLLAAAILVGGSLVPEMTLLDGWRAPQAAAHGIRRFRSGHVDGTAAVTLAQVAVTTAADTSAGMPDTDFGFRPMRFGLHRGVIAAIAVGTSVGTDIAS